MININTIMLEKFLQETITANKLPPEFYEESRSPKTHGRKKKQLYSLGYKDGVQYLAHQILESFFTEDE